MGRRHDRAKQNDAGERAGIFARDFETRPGGPRSFAGRWLESLMRLKLRFGCWRTIRILTPAKASYFTSAGTNEMDAAIMDGKTLAAVLRLLRSSMCASNCAGTRRHGKSKHVMMVGAGARNSPNAAGSNWSMRIFFHSGSLGGVAENEGGGESWRRRSKKFITSDLECHGTVGASGARRSGKSCRRDVDRRIHKLPGRVGDRQ